MLRRLRLTENIPVCLIDLHERMHSSKSFIALVCVVVLVCVCVCVCVSYCVYS